MSVAKIPLNALKVADGKVAVTLAIKGLDPASIIINAADLDVLLREVDNNVREVLGSRNDEQTHVALRRIVDQAMREGDNLDKKTALISVLWLTLNHPHHSEQMRLGVSQSLRSEGRCHLSVAVDSRRFWAFALAESWVDMTAALDTIIDNQHFSIAYGARLREKPLQ